MSEWRSGCGCFEDRAGKLWPLQTVGGFLFLFWVFGGFCFVFSFCLALHKGSPVCIKETEEKVTDVVFKVSI